MKSLRFFLLGLALGLAGMWVTVKPPAGPSDQTVTFGIQAGLPKLEPGEFRVRLEDGFVSAQMTKAEHAAISNVVSRLRTFKNRPPPPSVSSGSVRLGE